MTALIELIARRLALDEPAGRVARETAGVAVIFRPPEKARGDGGRGSREGQRKEGEEEEEENGDDLLLIKRATRDGDPWSGQVAFPGGRVEQLDASFRETATRETYEEVGIKLDSCARFLGYMGPFEARSRSMQVVPSVFLIERGTTAPSPNREVQSYSWTSFGELLEAKRRSTFISEPGGIPRSFPSFELKDGYVVWGLTERILASLMEFAASD